MKALSLLQASNCEQAKEPVCRCRCGGQLHGAKRGKGADFFGGLPEEDPHHVDTPAIAREKRNAAKRAATESRLNARLALYSRLYAPREE